MPSTIEIHGLNQFKSTTRGNAPCLVYFYANWCGNCTQMSGVFQRAAEWEGFNTIKFCKVDTDSTPEVDIDGFSVEALPTLYLIRSGKVLGGKLGFVEWEELKDWLDQYLHVTGVKRLSGLTFGPGLPITKAPARRTGKKQPKQQKNVPLVQVAEWSDEKFEQYLEEHKLVAVVQYLPRMPYVPLLEETIRSVTKTVKDFKFLMNDTTDQGLDSMWLFARPVIHIYRDGSFFSEIKGPGDDQWLKSWLKECMDASNIADSIPVSEDQDEEEEVQDPEDGGDNSGGDEMDEAANKNENEESEGGKVLQGNDDEDKVGDEETSVEEEEDEDEGEEEEEGGEEEEEEEDEEEDLIQEITSLEDFKEQTAQDRVIAVIFGDQRHHRSIALHLVAQHVASECQDISFYLVDYNSGQDVAESIKLHPNRCPITILFRNSAQLDERAGLVPPSEYQEWLAKWISQQEDSTICDSAEPPPPVVTVTESSTDVSNDPPASPPPYLSPFGDEKKSFSLDAKSMSRLSIASNASTISLPGIRCQGNHPTRPHRSRIFNVFHKRKALGDPELGCVFVPSDSPSAAGLEIGRVNEDDSSFNVTIQQVELLDHDQFAFNLRIGFIADVTIKARFKSAFLHMRFGYSDPGVTSELPLVADILPKDTRGEETEVQYSQTLEGGVGMSLGAGNVSATTDGRASVSTTYTRRTASRVRGLGEWTSRAEWTFQEDEGEAGRHGLDRNYDLKVILKGIHLKTGVSIEFWCKALLGRKSGWGSEVPLEMGTELEPYKRNVDLGQILQADALVGA